VSLRILLVRHGLSSFNLEHRIQGRDDLSSLTEEGVKQALATGEALRDLTITAAYSSPLRRAHDTATALLAAQGGGLEPRLDDDLLEVDLAPWSGLLSSEVQERFPEAYRTWKQHPERLELQRVDGSSYAPIPELMDQARRFVDRLLAEHSPSSPAAQTVLVVGHNAILRCLLLTLLGVDASGFRRLRVDNASLSVLNLSADAEGRVSVQIESLNGTTHLHPEVCGGRLPAKGPGPRLLLVRHGETDWNRQGRFQGQIDIPLNENGRAQAAAAGEFLRKVSFQRAYTSSMARPRQTAEWPGRAKPLRASSATTPACPSPACAIWWRSATASGRAAWNRKSPKAGVSCWLPGSARRKQFRCPMAKPSTTCGIARYAAGTPSPPASTATKRLWWWHTMP